MPRRTDGVCPQTFCGWIRSVNFLQFNATILYIHTHTHLHLTALFPGPLGWAGTRKVRPIWILLKQESEWQWHQLGHMQVCIWLQTDASTPPLTFFTGRMPFLPPNQQRQSTEGTCCNNIILQHYTDCIQTAGPYSIGLPFLAYYEWGWVTDSKKIQWLLVWDFLHTGFTFWWLANNVKVLIANDYTLLSVHTFGARSLRNSLTSLALAVCIILRRWPS